MFGSINSLFTSFSKCFIILPKSVLIFSRLQYKLQWVTVFSFSKTLRTALKFKFTDIHAMPSFRMANSMVFSCQFAIRWYSRIIQKSGLKSDKNFFSRLYLEPLCGTLSVFREVRSIKLRLSISVTLNHLRIRLT